MQQTTTIKINNNNDNKNKILARLILCTAAVINYALTVTHAMPN